MGNFYENSRLYGGSFIGRTLVQASGEIGGHRHVFVKLQGQGKNGLVFPTSGGVVKNPFKGFAKAFAGDLCEYRIDGTVRLLKTYEVAVAAEAASTSVLIVRDGYRHKPFVGDVLMAAPSELAGTGTAVTVTAVEKTSDTTAGDVWKVTLSATLGALTKGAVLVEGEEAGSDKQAVVKNPNAYLPCDYDFVYDPASGDDDFEGARYMLTPCLANEDTKLYVSKMSPLPASVKALNKSRVDGWFNL